MNSSVRLGFDCLQEEEIIVFCEMSIACSAARQTTPLADLVNNAIYPVRCLRCQRKYHFQKSKQIFLCLLFFKT